MIQSSCSSLTAWYTVQQGVFLPRDCSAVKGSFEKVSYRKLKQHKT